MQQSSPPYSVFTGYFLMLLILPISVMCVPVLGSTETPRTIRVSADCSVRSLNPNSAERNDPEKFPEQYKHSIVTLGPNQEQLVEMAFDALPEFVCKAVNRVAFVDQRNGDAAAWVGSKYPDLVMVAAPTNAGSGDHFATEDKLSLIGQNLQMVDPNTNNQMPVADVLKAKLEVWSVVIKTMMHEAMHSATNILESTKVAADDNHCSSYEKNIVTAIWDKDWGFKNRDADYYPNFWHDGAKSEANRMVEKTGLQEGVYNEWCRMQKSFVEAQMSKHYDGEISANNPTDIPEVGFFSKYGQSNPAEDIAEMASLIQFNLYHSQGSLKVGELSHLDISEGESIRYAAVDFTHKYTNVCKEKLQTVQKIGITSNLAAIYTKMNLLLDLGYITEDAYNACIGTGKVGLENGGKDTTGFHVLDNETGAFKHSYNLTHIGHAPVSSDSDERSFILIGKGSIEDGGKVNNMDMWLRFNKTRTNESEKIYNLPRGIYKLDWNWQWFPGQAKVTPCPPLFSETDAPLTFYVNVEDAPSRSFCTVVGQILVTRSSKNFFEATLYAHKVLKRVGGSPVQLPSPVAVAGIPVPLLAGGVLVPEVRNFRVYIRWKR